MMDAINIDNYQAFIIDYYEGNLTAEQQADLLLFIENHPELNDEFESYEPVTLPPDEIAFPSKQSLLKNITEESVERYLVASMEGDLAPTEILELKRFLDTHPQFKNDKKLYELTRLQPDLSVIMANKNRLKMPVPVTKGNRTAYLYYAAAASLVLLIGAYFIVNPGFTDHPVAGNTQPAIKTPLLPEDTPRQPGHPGPVATATNETESKPNDQRLPESGLRVKLADTSIPAEKPFLAETVSPELPDAAKKQQTGEPMAYVPDISPELLREKLAAEISADPASFQGEQFDAFLDRVADPDSSFSVEEFRERVFTSAPVREASTARQDQTPVLNALAWGMSKLTGDVSLKKDFNDQGELIAYRFEAGKLKFGNAGNK